MTLQGKSATAGPEQMVARGGFYGGSPNIHSWVTPLLETLQDFPMAPQTRIGSCRPPAPPAASPLAYWLLPATHTCTCCVCLRVSPGLPSSGAPFQPSSFMPVLTTSADVGWIPPASSGSGRFPLFPPHSEITVHFLSFPPESKRHEDRDPVGFVDTLCPQQIEQCWGTQ